MLSHITLLSFFKRRQWVSASPCPAPLDGLFREDESNLDMNDVERNVQLRRSKRTCVLQIAATFWRLYDRRLSTVECACAGSPPHAQTDEGEHDDEDGGDGGADGHDDHLPVHFALPAVVVALAPGTN